MAMKVRLFLAYIITRMCTYRAYTHFLRTYTPLHAYIHLFILFYGASIHHLAQKFDFLVHLG